MMVNDAHQWVERLEPNTNCCIVACAHNDNREGLVVGSSSSCESKEGCYDSNCLPDELLMEILCRLPGSKSAIRCKSVCKSWLALISQPDFIHQFCRMNIKQRRVILFHQQTRSSTLRNHIFNIEDSSLTVMPHLFENKNAAPVYAVGACNDLVLYRQYNDPEMRLNYYIGNIQTKQWIQLPSPSCYYSHSMTGFVCDPYYPYVGENKGCDNINQNASCRYSIVVIPNPVVYCPNPVTRIPDLVNNIIDPRPGRELPANKFTVYLFSSSFSKSCQWRERVLSFPTPCSMGMFYYKAGFPFGGMLHFVFTQGLISFDPYDDGDNHGVIQCRFVAWPLGALASRPAIGVCKGHLMMSSFHYDNRVSVWELTDTERGEKEWRLLNSVMKEAWLFQGDARLAQDWQVGGLEHPVRGFVLGIHPNDSDLIYVKNRKYILLCNLQRRTVVVVHPSCMKQGGAFVGSRAFPISIPTWPTPLPNLGL